MIMNFNASSSHSLHTNIFQRNRLSSQQAQIWLQMSYSTSFCVCIHGIMGGLCAFEHMLLSTVDGRTRTGRGARSGAQCACLLTWDIIADRPALLHASCRAGAGTQSALVRSASRL